MKIAFGFLCAFSSLFGAVVTNTNDSGVGSLRQAILDASASETITFNVSGTITLASPLPEITTENLTIDGSGQTIAIDGDSTYRPFFVSSTGVTLTNMTLQNCRAKGGNGGTSTVNGNAGGGGGMGAGGAVFINDTGGVTISNITFSSNAAVGGNGGNGVGSGGFGNGGGGGLGGDGGGSDGSGGGGGGGKLPTNTGGAGSGSAGSGAGGGGNGGITSTPGGAGSDFGGGGGGGSNSQGGAGGYGGGGGGSNSSSGGGAGGYGGGGGGESQFGSGGSGGTGGGNGASNSGGGGGGAGFGGNLFVRSGGSLSVDSNVTAGTVTAGSGGNGGATDGSAAGSGIYLDAATLILTSSSPREISGVIAGFGGLTHSSSSTTTLSGTNTYTGITTISEGTLKITGSIGSTSIVINNGTIEFDPVLLDVTFSPIIRQNGSLLKSGNSTLTLSATNDYSGVTTIAGGTLKITGSIGSTSAVINNSAIEFAPTVAEQTFSPVISGTGSLTKSGANTLILSGINTYSGTTTISGGTLTITGNIGNTESISNNGGLEFNLSDTISNFSPGISGTGSLTKSGTGSLTLSGTHTYSGATSVSAGTLVVTGTLASESTTTVGESATLKGTGTIGPAIIQGTMYPGTSIGTIEVVGNYTQSTGSTLSIELSPTASSKVNITGGSATIENGATLQIFPQMGTYSNTTYVFLEADGGITGDFDTISIDTSNFSGSVTHAVSYSSTQGFITLSGILSPLIHTCNSSMYNLTANLANRANRIQQGLLTEVQNQRLVQGFYCDSSPSEKLREEKRKAYPFFAPKKTSVETSDISEWFRPYIIVDYAKARINSSFFHKGGKDYLESIAAGSDFWVNKDFTFGLGLGYTHGHSTLFQNCGKIHSNNYSLGTYFQSEFLPGLFVDGLVNGMLTKYAIKRFASNGIAKAKPGGYGVSSQLRFLVQKPVGVLRIRPFIAWDYYLQHINRYQERPSTTTQYSVGKDHFYTLEMELGLNLWAPIWVGRKQAWNVVPNLGASFVQALCANNHSVSFQSLMAPSNEQKAVVEKNARQFWTLEVGASTFFQECSEAFVSYRGVFNKRYEANQEYKLGLRMKF